MKTTKIPYEEIKEFEIKTIIESIKRLLEIGFPMNKIEESLKKEIKQMLSGLSTEQLQHFDNIRRCKNSSHQN